MLRVHFGLKIGYVYDHFIRDIPKARVYYQQATDEGSLMAANNLLSLEQRQGNASTVLQACIQNLSLAESAKKLESTKQLETAEEAAQVALFIHTAPPLLWNTIYPCINLKMTTIRKKH